MKILKISMLIFLTSILKGQDTLIVEIPSDKLIELAQEKQKYLRRDSLNNLIITEQRNLIMNFAHLHSVDSATISLLTLDNTGLRRILDTQQVYNKKKWYQSPWIFYLLGSLTMYAGVHAAGSLK